MNLWEQCTAADPRTGRPSPCPLTALPSLYLPWTLELGPGPSQNLELDAEDQARG